MRLRRKDGAAGRVAIDARTIESGKHPNAWAGSIRLSDATAGQPCRARLAANQLPNEEGALPLPEFEDRGDVAPTGGAPDRSVRAEGRARPRRQWEGPTATLARAAAGPSLPP
jgi:hypothetical protein